MPSGPVAFVRPDIPTCFLYAANAICKDTRASNLIRICVMEYAVDQKRYNAEAAEYEKMNPGVLLLLLSLGLAPFCSDTSWDDSSQRTLLQARRVAE